MGDEIIKPLLISIVGPTAVGKTEVGIELAQKLDTEIVSADSRQFFREMEIGTAKPSKTELQAVKHHFVNSHSIEQSYNAGEFGRDAKKLLTELFLGRKATVAVGGSSLYLKALWEGFDSIPEIDSSIRNELNDEFRNNGTEGLLSELKRVDEKYYQEVDRSNHQRVIRALEVFRGTGKAFSSFRKAEESKLDYRNLKIGLNTDREILFERINTRMDLMIEAGLFDEASKLYSYKNHNALQTVGYSEIFGYMDGDYDRYEAIRLLKRNSRRYAKRQLTWFRRYSDIHWFEPSKKSEILTLVESYLKIK